MKQIAAMVGVLCLAGASAAQAQSPTVGVKVGVNFSKVSANESDIGFKPKIRTGALFGVFVVAPVNDMVAFQPEVLYSQQGAKADEAGVTAKVKLDYIQIPLLARIKLGKASPVGIVVGPSFGIRTKAEITSGDQKEDLKDSVKKSDVGLVTGVAVDAGRAVLDARYTWGLTNLSKDATDGKVKSRVFSLSVGVHF